MNICPVEENMPLGQWRHHRLDSVYEKKTPSRPTRVSSGEITMPRGFVWNYRSWRVCCLLSPLILHTLSIITNSSLSLFFLSLSVSLSFPLFVFNFFRNVTSLMYRLTTKTPQQTKGEVTSEFYIRLRQDETNRVKSLSQRLNVGSGQDSNSRPFDPQAVRWPRDCRRHPWLN